MTDTIEKARLCVAQTYWYENGVQRARWCDKPATMRTRALDGSINDFCDEHGDMTIEAGATPESFCPRRDAMPSTEFDTGLTKQPGECVTSFSVRLIQHDAWRSGHDEACPARLHPCPWHPSPFGDDSIFPPGSGE